MISKNTLKLIQSLALKKNRVKENLFLVEGDKNVLETLTSGFKVEKLFATDTFLNLNSYAVKNAVETSEVTETDIKKASLLKNPQNSLAICKLPNQPDLPEELKNPLSVYLDGIQDPGNLGTILRICDWFGIDEIFCSLDTADVFNPKVIQASMGSFCRVQVWNVAFSAIESLSKKSQAVILGAFLDGANIYNEELTQKALIVVGNEGNGIRPEVEQKIEKKIKIPSSVVSSKRAESLNVSVATGIIISEITRQLHFRSYSK